MSGKLKRLMAILAATGITANGVINALHEIMGAFPNNHRLLAMCSLAITFVSLAVTYWPVSIKDPNAGKQALPEPAVDQAASKK